MKGENPLRAAYGVLREALSALVSGGAGKRAVRDSDLKRKMLQLEPSFDERELGFGKFSRFLRQAHDHEIVDLEKREAGTYQVSPRDETLKKGTKQPGAQRQQEEKAPSEQVEKALSEQVEKAPSEQVDKAPSEQVEEAKVPRRGLGLRRGGSRGRKGLDGPPPLLEGQVMGAAGVPVSVEEALPAREEEEEVGGDSPSITSRTPRGRRGRPQSRAQEELPLTTPTSPEAIDLAGLGLPTEGPALVRYLTNSYKGVGRKTAERLVNEFGSGLFEVLHREPERLGSVIMENRVDQLLQGWEADLGRRLGGMAGEGQGREKGAEEVGAPPRRRTRTGTRGRGLDGGGKTPKDPS